MSKLQSGITIRRGKDHLRDPAGGGCPARFQRARRRPPGSPCCSASAPPPCPPGQAWWRAPPTGRPRHRASWGQSPSLRYRDTWRRRTERLIHTDWEVVLSRQEKVAYLAAVHCTHRSSAFLALPWNLFTTFLFIGGLPVSELARLSTEELLLERACKAGRLLVNSSI